MPLYRSSVPPLGSHRISFFLFEEVAESMLKLVPTAIEPEIVPQVIEFVPALIAPVVIAPTVIGLVPALIAAVVMAPTVIGLVPALIAAVVMAPTVMLFVPALIARLVRAPTVAAFVPQDSVPLLRTEPALNDVPTLADPTVVNVDAAREPHVNEFVPHFTSTLD